MCEIEYVLLNVIAEVKAVYVEQKIFAAFSEEAKEAHQKFITLKEKFSKDRGFNGYNMYEVKKNDNNLYEIVRELPTTSDEKPKIAQLRINSGLFNNK